MKKTIVTSVCSVMVLMFASVTVMSQTNDELKAKIEKLNKEIATALLQGNMDKNMSFYTKDVISMPNQQKMLEGIDALKKSSEEMMKSGFKVTAFETKTLKVSTCDKLITEIGTYKISITMPGMEKPWEDNGKYLTIWEKQSDGSLKIKLEMWNTDVMPQMEHSEHKM
jgi:ketosteroid isomerase-like protein